MAGWWCRQCGAVEGAEGAYRDARCPQCAGLVAWRTDQEPLTIACPGCRRGVEAAATRCPGCRLWFVPRRCEGCGEALAPEAQACTGCGVASEGADAARAVACPACGVALRDRPVGADRVPECPVCLGLLVPHAVMVRWTEDEGREAPGDPPGDVVFAMDWSVHYRRCPRCGVVMNRLNFAPGTGVIVDVCPLDGYWLDAGELPRMLAYVRSYGVEATAVGRMRGRRDHRRGTVPLGLIAADATGVEGNRDWQTGFGREIVNALVRLFWGM